MSKPGRNEPCPCGSGKKYKYCCGGAAGTKVIDASEEFAEARLFSEMANMHEAYSQDPRADRMTYQETRGTANAATDILNEIKRAMEGRSFASVEEANAFMEQFARAHDSRGLDDFLGLSPGQMHIILHGRSEETAPFLDVGVDVRPTDIPRVPILRQAHWILSRLLAGGPVRLTQAGYMPPALVKEWFAAAFFTEFPALQKDFIPSKESDSPLLSRLVYQLIKTGLLREDRGALGAGAEAAGLLAPAGLNLLYRMLFHSFIDLQTDPEAPSGALPLPDIFKRFSLFSFLVLARVGKALGRDELLSRILRAFPAVDAREEGMVVLCAPSIFAAEALGLIEPRSIEEEIRGAPLVKTDFFTRAIAWLLP